MRVLLVEDHPEVRAALAELLQSEGFDVAQAASAEEAIAAGRAASFDLLVSDQHLPGALGTELIETLRRERPELPALIITAASEVPKLRGVRAISKPMDLDQFLGEVRQVLSEAGREAPPASPPVLSLRMYVSSKTPASVRALSRLQQLLAPYDPSGFALQIFDFAEGVPPTADADKVLGTPALLLEDVDGRRTWVLGDLQKPDALRLLLENAGVGQR